MTYDHICTDADCPFTGQRKDRGCKCHKTPEQMRDAEITALRERVTDLLRFNNEFEARAREAERAIKALTIARPIAEYDESMGDVLWWKFPIAEPPYVGGPNDLGHEVVVETGVYGTDHEGSKRIGSGLTRVHAGGWPGYHTHFTTLPHAIETRR